MDFDALYNKLFSKLVSKHGDFDIETITSVVGFVAGGPVSMLANPSAGLHVTCELATNPEQVTSTDGLKYEFMSSAGFGEAWCRSAFTALGAMSMGTALGKGHTIDLSGVLDEEPSGIVMLSLFSKAKVNGVKYGVYEVVPQ